MYFKIAHTLSTILDPIMDTTNDKIDKIIKKYIIGLLAQYRPKILVKNKSNAVLLSFGYTFSNQIYLFLSLFVS